MNDAIDTTAQHSAAIYYLNAKGATGLSDNKQPCIR